MPAGDEHDKARIAEGLASIVREAGEAALRAFRGGPVRSWTKANASPVSEADLAVNHLLHRRLPPLVPHSGWLSEESEDDHARLAARRIWVVDPIDGTRAFLKGLEDGTISVALVEDGRPILAAVFAPAPDQLYLAIEGRGATLDGEPIAATAGSGLNRARVAGPQRFLDTLARLSPGVSAMPKVHSLALRLVRVASGELDAAFASANSHDWDLAAADLLVHEAGGALTTVQGERLVYNTSHSVHRPLVAAGTARHERLLDLIGQRQSEFA